MVELFRLKFPCVLFLMDGDHDNGWKVVSFRKNTIARSFFCQFMERVIDL